MAGRRNLPAHERCEAGLEALRQEGIVEEPRTDRESDGENSNQYEPASVGSWLPEPIFNGELRVFLRARDALAALADWSPRDARALAAALERARIAAVRVRSISESGMASAEASFCASNLHNKAADKTTPLRDNRVRRRSRARHIADRSTRPVQSLDDRHGVAPILCRRTLRPQHDALSLPSSAIDRCPRCFSSWSRSNPRRAYPMHGGPAEQSA